MDRLQDSLQTISQELKETEERRERILKGTRDIVSLCSKSVVDIHHGMKNDAKEKLMQANSMLAEFRNYSIGDLQKYLMVPEQEYVEASILMSIAENSEVPGVKDLNVSGPAYTMGSLDCIGEIKRMVYDKVRRGMAEEAKGLFDFVEQLYVSVYPFAIYDNLVSGLRRKLDVAKMIIEDVRILLTEESRRESMIKAIQQLERQLSERSSS